MTDPKKRAQQGDDSAAASPRESYPALTDFLRGYLHQDFREEHGDIAEEMALAACDRGYRFLCLTDHSHYLRDGRMEAQWEEIADVNLRLKPFKVLRGVEANITARGVVDVPDEVLAELDYSSSEIAVLLSTGVVEESKR